MDKRRPTTVTATGKPVYLRALLEDQDDELQAHAQRIVYRADQRSIELSGNAWVRQGEDEVRAEILTYDLDRQRLRASGAEAGAPGGDGRVYAIFHPKAKDEKP
jgi:lipopolysaccharide export system protein LptA